MKSLVEEASSVVKAIEKAWNRAGNPQTFSVKVFEVPETNFFGFTTKSAKVGIFFEEEAPQPVKKYTNNRDSRSQNGRQGQKSRDAAPAHSRDAESEVAPRSAQNRSGRPQNTRPTRPAQQPRQEVAAQAEQAQPMQQAPRSRDEQPQRQSRNDQRPRNNDRNDRADRNDRYERSDRQAAPRYENNRPARDEYAHDSFKEEQVPYTQPVVDRVERYEEPTARPEREDRRAYDRNDRNERSDRNDRGDRRDNRGDRRGQNSRSNRNGDRPQRAQRHEFDEQREMVNMPQESAPYVDREPGYEAPVAPQVTTPAPSLIPQKKVLKVSGRRYSAPTKPTTDNE